MSSPAPPSGWKGPGPWIPPPSYYRPNRYVWKVRKGRRVGLFTSWTSAANSVNHFSSAEHERHDNYQIALESWYQGQVDAGEPFSPPPIDNIPTFFPGSVLPETTSSGFISASIASFNPGVPLSVDNASTLLDIPLESTSSLDAPNTSAASASSDADRIVAYVYAHSEAPEDMSLPPSYPESAAPPYQPSTIAPSYATAAPAHSGNSNDPDDSDDTFSVMSDGVPYLNAPLPDAVHDFHPYNMLHDSTDGETMETAWLHAVAEEVPDLEELPNAPNEDPIVAPPFTEPGGAVAREPALALHVNDAPTVETWCEDGVVKMRDTNGNVGSYTADEYWDMQDAHEVAMRAAAASEDPGLARTTMPPASTDGTELRLLWLCEDSDNLVSTSDHELALLLERQNIAPIGAREALLLQDNIEQFSRQAELARERQKMAQNHLRRYYDERRRRGRPRRVADMRDPPEPSTDGDTVHLVDTKAATLDAEGKGKAHMDAQDAPAVKHARSAVAPFDIGEGVAGPSGAVRERPAEDSLDSVLPPVFFASYERFYVAVTRNTVILYIRTATVTESYVRTRHPDALAVRSFLTRQEAETWKDVVEQMMFRAGN